MRDSRPRAPLLHPTYRKQRDALLTGYNSLSLEDRELVRMAVNRWAFMERSRHRQWQLDNGKREKPRILGA